jgi:hypothetical protein
MERWLFGGAAVLQLLDSRRRHRDGRANHEGRRQLLAEAIET